MRQEKPKSAEKPHKKPKLLRAARTTSVLLVRVLVAAMTIVLHYDHAGAATLCKSADMTALSMMPTELLTMVCHMLVVSLNSIMPAGSVTSTEHAVRASCQHTVTICSVHHGHTRSISSSSTNTSIGTSSALRAPVLGFLGFWQRH